MSQRFLQPNDVACADCRESHATVDERPVSTLLSTLIFRQAKPLPRKVVGGRVQEAYSQGNT